MPTSSVMRALKFVMLVPKSVKNMTWIIAENVRKNAGHVLKNAGK
jgi:hypothetical protein